MKKAQIVLSVFTIFLLLPIAAKLEAKTENKDSQEVNAPKQLSKEELKAKLQDKAKWVQENFKQTAQTVDVRKLIDCQKISDTAYELLNTYQESYPDQLDIYNSLNIKLNELVSQFTNNGMDVTVIEEKLGKLQSLVDGYAKGTDSGLSNLEKAVQQACDNKSLDYKTSLETSKKELSDADGKVNEIKTFYLEQIRPEVKIKLEEYYSIN